MGSAYDILPGDPALDLENMAWPDAVREARAMCGKTNKQLAVEFSAVVGRRFPESTVQRWFNPCDDGYWPSSMYLPHLCRVLDNHVLVSWIVAHTVKEDAGDHVLTPEELAALPPLLMEEFGRVGAGLSSVLRRGGLTPENASRLRGVLGRFTGKLSFLRKVLHPLASRRKVVA